MENINKNYKKVSLEFLKSLPERQREVISRRFGLQRGERETLESIGRDFKITRERVRQIEDDGLSKLKEKINKFVSAAPAAKINKFVSAASAAKINKFVSAASAAKINPYQKVFEVFTSEIKKNGGLKKEDVLLSELGGKNLQPYIFFLLTLAEPFQRVSETEEFHPFWTINQESLNSAKQTIDAFSEKLKETNRPMKLDDYKAPDRINDTVLGSFLEISKIIQKNDDGFYGFRDWPEINPRGVKNKAYVVFKKENRPLHFVEVARLIGPEALPQTVHNELIKDPRFVLVGRGLYALKEWGYEAGQVKDVILKILKEAKKPLTKEEILAGVLKQRMVKENTILLNLNNKKYFFKTPEGKYFVQKS